jgi:hypothetical protein
MNEVEEQLVDELHAIAADLDTPMVDVAGLEAAGQRARVLSRVAPGLAVAAAAAVAAGLIYVLPHHGWPGTDPADAPNVATDGASDLGRPLELPWWGWDGVSADGDAGLLRVGNSAVPVDGVTAIVDGGDVTLIEQDQGRWSVLEPDALRQLSDIRLDAAPVVGVDGVVAYVIPRAPGGHTIVRDRGGKRAELTVGAPPAVVAVDRNRVLVTIANELFVWTPGTSALSEVTGLPPDIDADQYEARPGGMAIHGRASPDGDTLVAGAITGTKFRALWEVPSHGSGLWSPDGDIYATAVDGKVFFATEAGQAGTGATLPKDQLRVVGWESDTEVIIAQWIEVDGAVTGLWRCSATALRCAQIQDPNGKAVLPGLPAR